MVRGKIKSMTMVNIIESIERYKSRLKLPPEMQKSHPDCNDWCRINFRFFPFYNQDHNHQDGPIFKCLDHEHARTRIVY